VKAVRMSVLLALLTCLALAFTASAAFADDAASSDTSGAVEESAAVEETPADSSTPTDTSTPDDSSSPPPDDSSSCASPPCKTTEPPCEETGTCSPPPTCEDRGDCPKTCEETDTCDPCPEGSTNPECTPELPQIDPPPNDRGSGALPFTGPGDTLFPLLLGLLAMIGGTAMYMYATSRDVSIASANRAKATLKRLSGFTVVLNDVEREDERRSGK
jgi:hypothetical protein